MIRAMTGTGWEGWFTDPSGRHEARWLSEGTPTNLVRDGTVESFEETPEGPPNLVPEAINTAKPDSGAGLKRAEDRWRTVPQSRTRRGAWYPLLRPRRRSRIARAVDDLPTVPKTILYVVLIGGFLFFAGVLADHLMHVRGVAAY
jgi:hypothetical protein